MVKRLALWQPPDGTLFEKAAKRVRDFSHVPESVRKRARMAAKQAVDYTEVQEDYEANAWYWSDEPEETDECTQAVLDELKKVTSDEDNAPNYFSDFELILEYKSTGLFDKAFKLAARRLFGSDDHGLELTFYDGGNGGNADDGASEQLMMLRVLSVVRNDDGFETNRGAVGGVPWGCLATPIPTDIDMEAKRAKIQEVINAFGFRVEKPAGWYLVTVASGG
jgi:hypothetical protein